MSTSFLKIIIADDHSFMRQSLDILIKNKGNLSLIAEAKNGRELVDLARMHQPDIIITDIYMQELSGIEAIKALAVTHPHIAVIAISMETSGSIIYEVMEAGAKAYVLKSAPVEQMYNAIDAVLAGNTYYCIDSAPVIDAFMKEQKWSNGNAHTKPLTLKELEILSYTCNEMTSKQISEKLNLSPRTIEDYKQKIQRKTKTSNAIGMVKYAIINKLFSLGK